MKLKYLILYLMFAIVNLTNGQTDSIFTNGTSKVSFNLKTKVSFYYISCTRRTTSAITVTTPTTITGIGKVLFKNDGTGTLQPTKSDYLDRWVIYETLECGMKEKIVYVGPKIINKPDPTPNPLPTLPFSYSWKGNIGNSSSVDYGSSKIKGLRSPCSVTDMGGYLYIVTGFNERTGTLLKLPLSNLTTSKPLPSRNGDISLEGVSICSDLNRVYMVGFDPHGYDVNGGTGYSSKIDCAIVSYDINDNEVIFQYGEKTSCTIQDNPYKSLIAVTRNDTNQRPINISVDDKYLYVYTKSEVKTYDKLTGQYLSKKAYSRATLSSYSRNGVNLVMTPSNVTYNGKVLCSGQTSPKVDNYTYSTKDINHSKTKGYCYIGTDGSFWVCDAGNSRVLHYSASGTYLNQVNYIPMNYNCSVDRNNPTRLFAGVLEYKISYPNLTWELVANWSYGLNAAYLPIIGKYENTSEFMRNVVTIGTETFAIVDSINSDYFKFPCKMKLTSTGMKRVKVFEPFANIYLDLKGNDYWLTYNELIGGQNQLYQNGKLIYTTPKITDKSASYKGNGGFVYKEDSTLILFNGEKNATTNYHLEFQKNGVIQRCGPLYSPMRFPQGDTFCLYDYGGSAAARSVYNLDNVTCFMYTGEGFMGAQTTKLFIYKGTEYFKTIGKTYQEAINISGTNDSPKEYAGNAREGQLVKVDNVYYYFFCDEHGGAIQCFIMSGVK